MHAVAAFLLTALVPGTGHLLYRRYLKGAVLAMIYGAALNIFLVSRFLMPVMAGAPLPWVALGMTAAVWLFAMIDLAIRLKSLSAKEFQSAKDDLLKAAQVAWLKDEYPQAERLLREILRKDERDVEAWVHLGKVLKAVGRASEARICFRSALNLDGSGTWRWMLREELGYAGPGEATSTTST